MSPIIRGLNLTKSYASRAVLAGIDIAVDPGHRVGLVGENGVGKSTLLRLLAGGEEPDDGAITRPDDVGFLSQELPYSPTTTLGAVVTDALAPVRKIERELERAGSALAEQTAETDHPDGADPQVRFDLALARAEFARAWEADARVGQVLAGLGLAGLDSDRRIDEISGGQRSRLALAALLIRQPTALLLDEPTNHLDDSAAQFLAQFLRELPGAVLFASHDRVFLDEVASEIFDLDPSETALRGSRRAASSGGSYAIGGWYGGNYSDFRRAKRIEREHWEQKFHVEQDEFSALREATRTTARNVAPGRAMTDRNKMSYGRYGDRVEGQVSRRVRNAQQRLDQLEAQQVRRPPEPLRFAPPRLTGSGPDDGLVLSLRDVVVDGRLDLPALGLGGLDLPTNGRWLVAGANGTGKSTLLRLLAGDLEPDRGRVERARGVQVALLEQDVGLADDERTPQELLTSIGRAAGAVEKGGHQKVESFGLIPPRDLGRPLRELSVGQRRRVVLAMLMVHAPDVLLLDEPTNHISLALTEELLAALERWPGAVVIAAHDRWVRRNWSGDVVSLSQS